MDKIGGSIQNYNNFIINGSKEELLNFVNDKGLILS